MSTLAYLDFLARKAPMAEPDGIEPGPMRPCMTGFRAAAVATCLRRGRAAAFLDTGLGKTSVELEFADQAARHTGKPSLILTPLAVAKQMEREAIRFGYPARVVRAQDEVGAGISICNYDRIDRLDASAFGAVVLDESSILKSFTGKTTQSLISQFANTPFRLAATATPAPNDHVELGTHAEFLGVMNRTEMLVRWFINDTSEASQVWRLKKHAVASFWDWVASWAVMAESPADMGFDGSAFVLPEMRVVRHKVLAGAQPTDGLFGFSVSAIKVHGLKRQTADVRAQAVSNLVASEPDEPWIVWCDTDGEADALKSVLPKAFVEVRGSMPIERKEAALEAFSLGHAPGIITKPSIAGMGLNWQLSARMAFVGRSFSYEAWYQAVRRAWRFGQKRPVDVHIIVAEGEDQIGRVIDRKAADHATMKAAMRAAQRRANATTSQRAVPYSPNHQGALPSWL